MKIFLLGIFLFCQISSYSQLHFSKGSYYDLKGNKTQGYIALSKTAYMSFSPVAPRDASNSFIYFKKDSLDVAETRIKGWKLKSFTLGTDSFAVLRNFEVIGIQNLVKVPIGFCRVLVGDGKVLLYTNSYSDFSTTGGDLTSVNGHVGQTANITDSYLLQQENSETVIPVRMGLDEFIEQMSSYFKISDEIVNRIKEKEYSYFTTEKLVRDFNAWYVKRKAQKG